MGISCVVVCVFDELVGTTFSKIFQKHVVDKARDKAIEWTIKKVIADLADACMNVRFDRAAKRLIARVGPGMNFVSSVQAIYGIGACSVKCF